MVVLPWEVVTSMDGLSKCKVDPFGVCSLRAKADSVLSVLQSFPEILHA